MITIPIQSIRHALALWRGPAAETMTAQTSVCLSADADNRIFLRLGGGDAVARLRLDGSADNPQEEIWVAYGDLKQLVQRLPRTAGPLHISRARSGLIRFLSAIGPLQTTMFVKEAQSTGPLLPVGDRQLVAADPDGEAIRIALSIYPACANASPRFAVEHVALSVSGEGVIESAATSGFLLATVTALCAPTENSQKALADVLIHRAYATAVVALTKTPGAVAIYYQSSETSEREWVQFVHEGGSLIAIAIPSGVAFPELQHITNADPCIGITEPLGGGALAAACRSIQRTTRSNDATAESVGIVWDNEQLRLSTTESEVSAEVKTVGGPSSLCLSLGFLQAALRLCGNRPIYVDMISDGYSSLRLTSVLTAGEMRVFVAPRRENIPSPNDGIFKA